jgi:magnesium transporter
MRALSAADAQEAAACHARGEAFWLDLQGAGQIAELDALRRPLGLSDLDFEGLTRFGQPPRLAAHEHHALLVVYGARIDERGDAEAVEVHILFAPGELLTVHRVSIQALAELDPDQLDPRNAVERLLARLTDSLVTVLEAIDDQVDVLEEAIIEAPADSQLRRLTELRRALVGLRRAITPQRDLFLREADALAAREGLSTAGLREIQARLVMARDVIDSTRELVTGAVDLYQSTVSTRLSATGDRLAVIATVVLPLAVVTGFFGQNFGWLVQRIDTFLAFALLGLLAPVLIAGGLLYVLRRRGYL